MARCDSCGRPLHDDTHGTEADGSSSASYCGTCYVKGAFTLPDGPMEAVQAKAVEAIVAQGVPPLSARKLTEGIGSLPRWR